MSTTRYSHLQDDELARLAWLERDPLTATALEDELLKRFEDGITALPFASLLEKHGFDDPSDAKQVARLQECLERDAQEDERAHAVLEVALQHDIDTPEALDKALKRLARLDSALTDITPTLQALQAA